MRRVQIEIRVYFSRLERYSRENDFKRQRGVILRFERFSIFVQTARPSSDNAAKKLFFRSNGIYLKSFESKNTRLISERVVIT